MHVRARRIQALNALNLWSESDSAVIPVCTILQKFQKCSLRVDNTSSPATMETIMEQRFEMQSIGIIRTPYINTAPYQPVTNDGGEFRIIVRPEYTEGLADLETFRYIYVLYFINRLTRSPAMTETPSWTPDTHIGLFASRSPVRPNPIGLSIVQLKKVAGNEVYTSGLDVFDNTPLLDIKPYIKDLDSKNDANYGWIDNLSGDKQHLLLHIMGIPHDYY